MVMPLIYITGAPGSGKSTVEQGLRRLGYDASDADVLGAAYDNVTGAITTVPPVADRTPDWFKAHSWKVAPPKVEELKRRAQTKLVFLCGTASNEDALWSLFDRVLLLQIDPATLTHRIKTRRDNDYGKSDHELADILRRHEKLVAKYLDQPDIVMIDATKPLPDVIGQILAASNELRGT
jgi:dephospho-CoA kinase